MSLACVNLTESWGGGGGGLEIKGGYSKYEIGKAEDNLLRKRLGIFNTSKKKKKDCDTDFKTYSNGEFEMKVNLQGEDLVTVINAYAPTSSAEDEMV